MSSPPGWTLAIDFGTTTSVAALRAGEETALVEVDGATSMSSGVFLDPAVGLLAGAEATERAAQAPVFFEPAPRRRLQEDKVSLGGFDMPATEVAAAVLERLHEEACRAQGTPPDKVRLTYPAGWTNSPKLGALGLAAVAAGIQNVRFAPEAVAAAQHIVNTDDLAVGARLAILDLAGGALDCAVVEYTWWGLVVVGVPGGLDPFDADAAGAAEAAAHELAASIEAAGLTADQLAGIYLGRGAADSPDLAAAVEHLVGVAPRPIADPAAAIALGAAVADDDLFTTIGSLSKATRQAAMARNKAAGNAVMAAGATAARDFGADEPEGDIWWRDMGLPITLTLLAGAYVLYLIVFVIGGG
jgi:molecular chaperone DnaK (HSP70)